MTVATNDGSAVESYGQYGDNIGLEDVSASDLTIPRITIVHAEGLFKDSLSGETFPALDAVLLGVVKQRVMWHSVVDDGDKPMCKSADFEHGFPNNSDEQPKEKRFPWAKSNFNADDFPAENGTNGLVTLPCQNCVFSQWDKGDWKQPPCAEQHTFPLFYTVDEGDSWSPGLFTVQKTGIKPSRTYISSFASAKRPLFTVKTKITLKVNTRGTVTYSVPTFAKNGPSDPDQWDEYGATYLRVRDVIRTAPRGQSDDEDATVAAPAASANQNTAPAAAAAAPAQPAASAATPAAQPAASVPSAPASDTDDMPF